ncbi:MAG: DNA-binding response regulator [Gemmatimonadetes bacterium]|nr:DNA-binding response regulator [Gemmatimonadota bacterium]|tara:strand:- start:2496 stop:3188 length:693 start_codon:yes stop_codon:yes gene_type:complete
MEKILVLEDEPDILGMVQYNLERAGFEVRTAEDGETGLELVRSESPSLLILDLMLPGIDGLDVCKSLKSDAATKDLPVLMLTARKDEVDRILGFELGADDYVVKPFSPRELILRVRAILRRAGGEADETEADIQYGGLRISRTAHQVWIDEKPLALTATEFKLLTTLIDRKGRVQTREDLLDTVWGYEYAGYGRTVDTHVRRLREKLGPLSSMIETVRGVGYRFSGIEET